MGVKVSHRAFSSDRVKLLKRLLNEDNSENVRFNDLLKEIMKEALKENAEGNFPGIIFDENEVLEEEDSDEDEENRESFSKKFQELKDSENIFVFAEENLDKKSL